jgi:hypothetical protein
MIASLDFDHTKAKAQQKTAKLTRLDGFFLYTKSGWSDQVEFIYRVKSLLEQ